MVVVVSGGYRPRGEDAAARTLAARRSVPPPRGPLSVRDRAGLRWIGEQRAASLDDLAVVLGRERGTFGHRGEAGSEPLARAAVQRIVKRWTDAGMARRLRAFVDMPVLVVLTQEGARVVHAAGYREPALSSLDHVLAVNQLRLSVEGAGARNRWVAEQEARLLWEIRTSAPYNEHMPDGFLAPADEEEPSAGAVIAVEVERHSKSSSRREVIVRSNLQRFRASWWACETESVAEGIRKTVRGLHESDRQRVYVTVGYQQLPGADHRVT